MIKPAVALAVAAAGAYIASGGDLAPAADSNVGEPGTEPDPMPYQPNPPATSPLVYPAASRRIQARYTTRHALRRPDLIVLHSTDGKAAVAEGTARYFASMSDGRRASAHYVVGRDGVIVECADPDNEDTWHARGVNARSVGIEHQGSKSAPLTPAQYQASSSLVAWLCARYGIPFDRRHVVGHAEADKFTTHTECPVSSLSWGAWTVAAAPLGFRAV